MLALTGGFMMIYADQSNELGWAADVAATGPALPVSNQAEAALAAVPDATLSTYIAPETATRPAFFEFQQGDAYIAVAVDPYSGAVLNVVDETKTWRAFAEKIHGTFLLGTTGDRLIEAAASLSIVLIATGLFLWWPREGGWAQAFVPRFTAKGRALWRDLHKVSGVWISLFWWSSCCRAWLGPASGATSSSSLGLLSRPRNGTMCPCQT